MISTTLATACTHIRTKLPSYRNTNATECYHATEAKNCKFITQPIQLRYVHHMLTRNPDNTLRYFTKLLRNPKLNICIKTTKLRKQQKT